MEVQVAGPRLAMPDPTKQRGLDRVAANRMHHRAALHGLAFGVEIHLAALADRWLAALAGAFDRNHALPAALACVLVNLRREMAAAVDRHHMRPDAMPLRVRPFAQHHLVQLLPKICAAWVAVDLLVV